MNNTTIVTALYDIGRGLWNNQFRRMHQDYIEYFKNILSFDTNLIIFIDEKDLAQVQIYRSKIDPEFKKTKIVTTPFTQLEAYQKFYLKCKSVMESSFFIKHRFEHHTPEMNYPEYNIINFNKVSFLEKSIQNNPFDNKYFMWIDAGFYHHRFPKEHCFKEYPNCDKIKIFEDNKVHFLTLSEDIELSSPLDPRVSITGSMFGGKSEPLLKLKNICFETIQEFLAMDCINDDQTIYAYAYKKDPSLFNLKVGDWFENFYFYI
jgi:protein YibB